MTILEAAISMIAPHDCLSCGKEGSLLCAWCVPEILSPLPPRCYKCYRATEESLVCKRCRLGIRLKHVWVTTEYDGLAKELVRVFKFGRAQAAATIIAEAMSSRLPYLPDSLVVPVPTASSRRRQRGYDQAELLAKHLATKLHLEHYRALARVGQTRQVGSKRGQRRQQLTNAFRPVHQKAVAGRHILIVDDIVTTGATLEAAARILKAAGAKTVDAIVFAQTK